MQDAERGKNVEPDAELLSFWRWAYSDLRSNTIRPMLAEYLVGKALGCLGACRRDWTPWDFDFEGLRIEVKSAGYVQSWSQSRPSKITFGIAAATNAFIDESKVALRPGRHADVYIFCLHKELDRDRAGLHDLEAWEFYVVAKPVLEASFASQKSLSLTRLAKIVKPCRWEELHSEVLASRPSVNTSKITPQ